MQIAKWNEQTQTPYDIRDRYSVKASNGVPYSSMASLERLGYHEYLPVALADGEGLDNPTWSNDGIIRQGGTVIPAQIMQERAEAEAAQAAAEAEAEAAQAAVVAEAARIAAYVQRMADLAPVLDGHPDPLDVMPGGMFYRLPDTEAPDILTLWYVRDSDHIAQQLSSHDAEGIPINRSVNLKTRVLTEYSLDEIVAGLKDNKAKAKKVSNV